MNRFENVILCIASIIAILAMIGCIVIKIAIVFRLLDWIG